MHIHICQYSDYVCLSVVVCAPFGRCRETNVIAFGQHMDMEYLDIKCNARRIQLISSSDGLCFRFRTAAAVASVRAHPAPIASAVAERDDRHRIAVQTNGPAHFDVQSQSGCAQPLRAIRIRLGAFERFAVATSISGQCADCVRFFAVSVRYRGCAAHTNVISLREMDAFSSERARKAFGHSKCWQCIRPIR